MNLGTDKSAPHPNTDLVVRPARIIAASLFGLALCLGGVLPFSAKDKKTVSAPTFSPRGGTFMTNVIVQLSARSAAVVIRYTLDGAEPDETSRVYSAPIHLTNSPLIRAKA